MRPPNNSRVGPTDPLATPMPNEADPSLVGSDARPQPARERLDAAIEALCRAIQTGGCDDVGRAADLALQAGAGSDDLAPAIEEAIAREDHTILTTLAERLGMERIHAAVPDFMFLSALADLEAEAPTATSFFATRGGLRYKAKTRRRGSNKDGADLTPEQEAALAELARREAAAKRIHGAEEGERSTPARSGHSFGHSGPSRSEQEARVEAELSLPAWIVFDDFLLDAVLSIGPSGATITEIREAILARDRAERQEADEIAQDARAAADEGLVGESASWAARGRPGAAAIQANRAEQRKAARAEANERAGDARRARARDSRDRDAPTAGQRLRARADELERLAANAPNGVLTGAPSLAGASAGTQRIVLSGPSLQLAGTAPGVSARALRTAPGLVSLYGSAAAVAAMFASIAGFPVSSSIGGVNGVTPLHLAAMSGNLEAVKALLAEGADPEALDSQGMRPLEIAAAAGFDDVFEELNQAVEQAPLREAMLEHERELRERELRAESTQERAGKRSSRSEEDESTGERATASAARGPSRRRGLSMH